MTTFPPGTIVDSRYQILQQIGEGGMGNVYKAREEGLERILALKFLQPFVLGQEETRERFLREAKVLSSLDHPSIVSFYRFGFFNQFPYIAMEFVDGTTLRSYLNAQTYPGLETVVQIASGVCDALSYAHGLGVVHRDLKPDNIIVTGESAELRIKLIDFGLARIDGASEKLTEPGSLLGSAPYMSPEQCTGQKADWRSDIYSLACVVYELLNGSPPHISDNPVGLIFKHANDPVPPFTGTVLEHPRSAAIETVLLKALEKDPQERYQSMLAFEQDLQRGLVGADTDAKSRVQPDKKASRQRKILGGAIACGAILCGLGYARYLTNSGEQVWAPKEKSAGASHSSGRVRPLDSILREAYEKAHHSYFADAARVAADAEAEKLLDEITSRRRVAPPDGLLFQTYMIRSLIDRVREDEAALKLHCLLAVKYATSGTGKIYKPAAVPYYFLALLAEREGKYQESETCFKKTYNLWHNDEVVPESFALLAGLPFEDTGNLGFCSRFGAARVRQKSGDQSALEDMGLLFSEWHKRIGRATVELTTSLRDLAEAYRKAGRISDRNKVLDDYERSMQQQLFDNDRGLADSYAMLSTYNMDFNRRQPALRTLKQATNEFFKCVSSTGTKQTLEKTLERYRDSFCQADSTEKLQIDQMLTKIRNAVPDITK